MSSSPRIWRPRARRKPWRRQGRAVDADLASRGRNEPLGGPAARPFSGERSLVDVTVLVVEDDPDARELVERLLQEHDARVLTAASASEGLQILADARPDVLVCDIGLPEVDGYELIRRIRKSERPGEAIPAIALTAYAAAEDRSQALRAGYQGHLTKPVEGKELVATVARLVDLGAVGRSAERRTVE